MATLYCDFENGNDNYGGTSFALLASGTDGRISSTTFSSSGASFPNDGSLIGQYLSIFNGTIYAVYNITAWVSSTSLTIAAISGGTALANQTVDRQFYIGGRWKSLTSGATAVRIAPGDTVRIMGSPAPTSLGQTATWTSSALAATRLAIAASNTTPIQITTSTAHGYSTGDTVSIAGLPTSSNANGIWEITVTGPSTFTLDGSIGGTAHSGSVSNSVRLRNNTRVMLTTAVTQNIACTGPGRSAWIASANCTGSFNTVYVKEGVNSDQLFVGSAFTTGKSHYYTLPTTLDLSAYEQVSLWIFLSGDELLAGEAELRLCSDATGDIAVDTVPLPYTPGGALRAYTWDKGSPLGGSIASVSLYINTDLGATNVNVMLSNVIACKASSAVDSLTLTSLIGKNTNGETWWGIQSINGRRVMLDADTNATAIDHGIQAARGYYGGTTENVTTWRRETIKTGPSATTSTQAQTLQDSGTDGNILTYSGGWDRTNMSTQTLETWFDGVNGYGSGLQGAMDFVKLEKLALIRFNTALYISSGSLGIFDIIAIGHCRPSSNTGAATHYGVQPIQQFKVGHIYANATNGYGTNGVVQEFIVDHGIISNTSNGIYNYSGWPTTFVVKKGVGSGLIANNGSSGTFNARGQFRKITFADNTQDHNISNSGHGQENIYNIDCLFNSATEIASRNYSPGIVYSHNHDQTTGNHKIFMAGALVSSATDQRKTASGISWKIQPTSVTRSISYPVIFPLAKVAVNANTQVTVKVWMRRDNSGLTMRLVCKGGQIAGVANDVTASVTTTNAWEEEIITFTPTEAGVVEITAEAWGGTTFSGWVDDMTISQA